MARETEKLAYWSSSGGRPELDLAREEGLLEAALGGSPQLFAYTWDVPALVLGYAQRDLTSLDLELCRRRGIRVLRRCSGGTAVFQQGDLSVTLALPRSHGWASGIRTLYGNALAALQESVLSFGIETRRSVGPHPSSRTPICFEGRGDETLLLGERKVVGGAQVRRGPGVLCHFVVLFHLDAPLQAEIFSVSRERIERAMAPLPPSPGLSPTTLADELARQLSRRLGCDIEAMGKAPPAPDASLKRLADPHWVLLS
jgi:lipoate-protein ligase A